MIKKTVATLLLGATVAFAGSILPNNELQLGMLSQAAQKKMVVLANMHLKGDVKEKFGNLYDEYQKGLMKLRIEKMKLIESYAKSYKSMDDKNADRLLNDWIKLQKDEVNYKEKYIAEFKKVLPASLVIRFFQIENRINILQEAKVSSMIPLAIPDQAKKMEIKPRKKEEK